MVGDEQHFTQSNRVAVAQDAIHFDRRLTHDLPVFAVVKVALSAILDHRHVFPRDGQLGA
jgi:hypothetical protein